MWVPGAGRIFPVGRSGRGTTARGPRSGRAFASWATGTWLASYPGMVAEPEVSVLTGSIAQVAPGYVWLESGVRVVVLPGLNVPLRVGMLITVRAVRRRGQFIAEAITAEPAPP